MNWERNAFISFIGQFGGCLAAMALRPVIAATGALCVPTILYIPNTEINIDKEGRPLNEDLRREARTLVNHLDWCAAALGNHRDIAGPQPI